MAVHWRLKTHLATKHGIYGATAFQRLIVKKTGVLISLQNLCNYLEKKPKMIPLQTMELLILSRPKVSSDITPRNAYQELEKMTESARDFSGESGVFQQPCDAGRVAWR